MADQNRLRQYLQMAQSTGGSPYDEDAYMPTIGEGNPTIGEGNFAAFASRANRVNEGRQISPINKWLNNRLMDRFDAQRAPVLPPETPEGPYMSGNGQPLPPQPHASNQSFDELIKKYPTGGVDKNGIFRGTTNMGQWLNFDKSGNPIYLDDPRHSQYGALTKDRVTGEWVPMYDHPQHQRFKSLPQMHR